MQKMKVIGAVGLNGSGKDAVIAYISKKWNIPTVTISDFVKKIAAAEKTEPTRENLTRISLQCMEKYGPDFFPREVVKKIEQEKWNPVGIAGIRSCVDVETFRKRFGKDFVLIFVDVSDPNIRFQRLRKRQEPRDPETFDAFIEQDKSEEAVFKLSKAIKEADYVIKNDKDMHVLTSQVDKLLSKIFKQADAIHSESKTK